MYIYIDVVIDIDIRRDTAIWHNLTVFYPSYQYLLHDTLGLVRFLFDSYCMSKKSWQKRDFGHPGSQLFLNIDKCNLNNFSPRF